MQLDTASGDGGFSRACEESFIARLSIFEKHLAKFDTHEVKELVMTAVGTQIELQAHAVSADNLPILETEVKWKDFFTVEQAEGHSGPLESPHFHWT